MSNEEEQINCIHWFKPCGDGEHEQCETCGLIITLKL